jgi:sulfate permease, SulP family
MVAASVLALAVAGSGEAAALGATLGLLVGGLFLCARVVRLGWIADYLSRPVLVGYMHGVAVVLIVAQLGKLLGVPVSALDPIPQLVEVVRELGDVSLTTVVVSACALAVLLPLRFLAPRVPGALIVVVGGIAVSSWLDVSAHGVNVVGDIPSGLPHLGPPDVSLTQIGDLAPAALGIFLVALADGLLTARSFAGKNSQQVDASHELLALGAANVAAGFSGGMPVGASGSRTAVNDATGAHSQFAGLAAAGAVALILLFLTAPIADLPKPVLGAVIVSAAIGLVDPSAWRALRDIDSVEVAIAAVTAAAVVITGVLPAIAFAVGLSIVDVVRRSARPHDAVLGWVPELGRYGDVSLHRDAQVTPGVLVYRLDDRLFFANAGYVKGRMREALRGAPAEPHWLVLDAEALSHVDAAGAQALEQLAGELKKDDVQLLLARMKAPVSDRLEQAGVAEAIGRDRFFPTVRAAVAAWARGASVARSEHRLGLMGRLGLVDRGRVDVPRGVAEGEADGAFLAARIGDRARDGGVGLHRHRVRAVHRRILDAGVVEILLQLLVDRRAR